MNITQLYHLTSFIKWKSETFILWFLFGILVIIAIFLGAFYLKLKHSIEDRLRIILYRDTVTGLDNMLKFKENLSKRCEKYSPSVQKYCVAYVKISRFATLFHNSEAHCREALRIMANVWMNVLDDEETFARIDEESFVCLKKYMMPVDITDFLQMVNDRFNEEFSKSGLELDLILKCGVFLMETVEASEILPETMIEYARSAALSIVTTRESETVFYNDLLAASLVMERDIENMMLPALKHHEFELYLQPKFDIREDKMVGAEALVRWQSPKGLLMPDSFIPVFEKNGFVRKLDMYMFEEVCILIRNWIRKGHKPLPISINMSRAHLNATTFIDELTTLMEHYKIPYDLIEIELTESAFMDENVDVVSVMNQLKKAGFRLSMDDFGSGYSSLNMLRTIPIDVVKIDKGFMGRKDIDDKGRIVVKNIVGMVKELGLDIICEGVETSEQADFLKNVGCDRVQGYLYSKPLNIQNFEEMRVSKA